MKSLQIVFIGYVGIGKTTQISLLYNYFKTNRISVCKYYVKSFYPAILRFISKFTFTHKKVDKRRNGSVLPALSDSLTKRLMKTVLLIDIIAVTITYLLETKVLSFSKSIILMEEGLLGTIMEYMDAVWAGFIDVKFANRLVKFLVILIQKDNPLIVILLGKTSMLEERWVKRKSVFETETYLRSQQRIIEVFSKFFRERVILVEDQGNGIMAVHKTILSQLNQLSLF